MRYQIIAIIILFQLSWPATAHPFDSYSSPRVLPSGGASVIEFEGAEEFTANRGRIVSIPLSNVVFEQGVNGKAVRFVRDEKLYSAMIQFPAGIIDIADARDRGQKLEFWLKFNEDPHRFSGNKFLIQAYPVFMVEIYGSSPFLAFEFYGNGSNDATGGRFLTYTQGWDKWENWKAGEWHKITLVWKRNGKDGNAEMHLYIDDSQAGCLPKRCNDYRGILPKPNSFDALAIGNYGKKSAIDFSIDRLRIISDIQ